MTKTCYPLLFEMKNNFLLSKEFYTAIFALRTIFNIAIENEVIDASKYPFKKYNIPAPQKISRTLKKEEIKLIINYTAKRDADAIALDYWVFSFISNGMNFKDIALLKYGNINGDFIEFRRAKTKRTNNNNSLPIMVPLDESLLFIIKKRNQENIQKKKTMSSLIHLLHIKYHLQKLLMMKRMTIMIGFLLH